MTVREITLLELEDLRGESQFSQVYALPRTPNIIYTARLASVPTSTDMVTQISVDSGSGTASDIRADMKMLVGTTLGGRELGECRVRVGNPSLPSGIGNIKIGELSHIDWQAECYITITDDYDVFPRHLKIVSGVEKIDCEVSYTDQHESFEPIVIMGNHRVLIMTGETVSHQRDASDSSVFDGTIASYSWEAPYASSTTGMTTATPEITYDAEGDFVEYLTVTTDDDKTWTGVRFVKVIHENSLEANISKFGMTEDAEGVSASFVLFQDADRNSFNSRAFVFVIAIDYYNGEKKSIGYNAYEENILACGRVAGERMIWNDNGGEVEIEVRDLKYWMTRLPGFVFGVERAQTADLDWVSVTGLNVDRAFWILMHEYSTISRIADIHLTGDQRYAEELSSSASNLASQVEEVAFSSIFADVVFDRFGSGWLRIEPQLVPEADRATWPVIQDITSDDYEGELEVEIRTYEDVSQVNSSGVAVSQWGSGVPYFSLSYGRVFATYGDAVAETNLLLSTQAEANSLAGLLMGWKNVLFNEFPVKFIGNNRMFSIAEYCRAHISLTADNNPRGVVYDGYLCPIKIDTQWDNDGVIDVAVTFQDESVERISVTGDFPDEAGIDDIDFSSPPMPNIPIPPFTYVPLPPTVENLTHPREVFLSSNSLTFPGMYFTKTFHESDPEYLAMNSGILTEDLAYSYKAVVTPSGSIYLITNNGLYSNLYRASAIGGEWQLIWRDINKPVLAIGLNPEREDEIGFVTVNNPVLLGTFHICSGGTVTDGDDFATNIVMGDIVFLDGKYYFFGNGVGVFSTPWGYIFSSSGAALYSASIFTAVGQDFSQRFAVPLPNKIFEWDAAGSFGYNFIEKGTLVATRPSAIQIAHHPQAVAFSPTGTYGMYTHWATVVMWLSTDGGSTWNSLGGTIASGSSVIENCKDDNRFIFGGGPNIYLTLDRGFTAPINKTGNLLHIAPFLSLRTLRFIK